jgi:hypothetical protein
MWEKLTYKRDLVEKTHLGIQFFELIIERVSHPADERVHGAALLSLTQRDPVCK